MFFFFLFFSGISFLNSTLYSTKRWYQLIFILTGTEYQETLLCGLFVLGYASL